MSDKFTVEIISPDQTVLKQETKEVIIPSFEGQMGILNNHIPLITFLRPGIITIKAENEKKYYVEDGTVEFIDDNLLILTSTAKDVNNFDKFKEILLRELYPSFPVKAFAFLVLIKIPKIFFSAFSTPIITPSLVQEEIDNSGGKVFFSAMKE